MNEINKCMSKGKLLLQRFFGNRKKVIIAILIFDLTIIPLLLVFNNFRTKNASAAWWDDTWAYRKSISIPSHTNPETNVYVTVPTFDATDSTKFQSDCGDLRFTKQNGELLPYYVVDCDATATIHVNFDSLPAGASTYYMYYGNPSAPNGFVNADFPNAATGLGTLAFGSEEKTVGPVAYWKFDEGTDNTCPGGTNDSCDSTANRNDGINSNATWQTEDQCVSGKCLYYDGTNDSLHMDWSNYPTGSQPRTISAWIYPTVLNGTRRALINYGIASNGQYFEMAISTNNKLWFIGFNADFECNSALTTNTWSHVAIVYDGTNITCYLNGKQDGSAAKSLNTGSSYLEIGRQTFADAGDYHYYPGSIDEVKVYNYARSNDQIKLDYNSGLSGAGVNEGTGVSFGAKSNKWMSDGLVGYWKMEETSSTFVDSSGNGNSGTWNGGIASVAGKFGNAGNYRGPTGSPDYVSFSDIDAHKPSNTITVASWLKPSATTQQNIGIITKRYADASDPYNSYILGTDNAVSNNKYVFCISNGTAGSQTCVTSTIGLATSWQYIVGEYDGVNLYIYINGVLDNSTPKTGAIGYSNIGLLIGGARSIDNNSRFGGTIDEVRIYNRALNGSEVAGLYNWAPGPVGYWNMEEGNGPSVNDTSGNNYTGTLSGATFCQGKIGKAIDISSSGSISTGNVISQFGSANTISFWFNPQQLSADYYEIADKANIGSGSWLLRLRSWGTGKWYINLTMNNGSWSDAYSTSYFTTTNNWNHVAITFNSGTVVFYINGKAEATQGSVNRTTLSNAANFAFGAATMKLDDFKIYNYVRTAKQIVEDMLGSPKLVSGGGNAGQGALGYWKFDEGYGDVANNSGSAGTTINGDLAGACPGAATCPTWTNSGKFGKALSFDGGDYISVNSFGALTNASQLTLSAWVKPNVIDNARHMILAITGNTNNFVANIEQTPNNKFEVQTGKAGVGGDDAEDDSTIVAGNWYHVVGVFTESQIKLYVNGALKKTTNYNYASTATSNSNGWNIGKYIENGGSYYYWNGQIDEAKIYNLALTAEEIKLDYNRSSATVLGSLSDTSSLSGGSIASNSASAIYCVPGSTDPCNPPVGEWLMDERQGTNAYDTSGNGNTGTLTGATHLPTWSNGKIDSAVSLDNTDDYINGTSNMSGLTNLTAEAWIKLNALPPNTSRTNIIQIYTSTSPAFTFDIAHDTSNPGRMQLIRYNTWGTDGKVWEPATSAGDSRVVAGIWYHVTVTQTENTVKFYRNGVLTNTFTSPTTTWGAGNYPTSGTIWRIGNANATTYFNGLVDTVRVFDYVRTPAQIAWDYNKGKPVGLWRFDECSGGIAYDSSGNNNNGTITIGGTGTQTVLGTCTTPTDGTGAWYNGRNGKYNSSLSLDGTNDSVAINSYTNLPTGSNPLTLSAWFKMTGNLNSNQSIFYWGGNANGQRVDLWYDGSHTLGVENMNSVMTFPWTADSNWHQLTIIVPASATVNQQLVYLDGVKRNPTLSGPNSTMNVTVAGPEIGKLATYLFTGQIDEVKIFNYALTRQQVLNDYNQSSAVRFGPLTGTP